jgi:hypothetical protein
MENKFKIVYDLANKICKETKCVNFQSSHDYFLAIGREDEIYFKSKEIWQPLKRAAFLRYVLCFGIIFYDPHQ